MIPDPAFQSMKSEIPKEYHFCTYFNRNYLTRGLALYHSLVRHCQKPFTLWILCFDDETYDILSRLDLPRIRLISQQEFEAGDEELVSAKANRSQVEYYWTCTPSLPLYVLRHNLAVEVITYLDADLYFYSDPQPIYDELGDGSILIIEHRYAPEHAYLAAISGIYNVGVMAFRRDEDGLACLHWWRERCLEWCYTRVEDGKFGDQKYLDDWPDRFQSVVVLQHKGAGLAPWNISQYCVRWDRKMMTVDDQPLVFYHFHGFKLIHSLVCEPVLSSYNISAGLVVTIYLPYVQALKEAKARVRTVAPFFDELKPEISFRETINWLFDGRWLLTRAAPVARLLWRIGHVRDFQRRRLTAGFTAYYAGDLATAQRTFIGAIARNPFVLRNPGIVSILIESRVGSARMTKYRRWRRRFLPRMFISTK